MAEVVNLNRARKAKARAEARAQADTNAARFGRTKAEKALEKAQADKAARDHDGHRRDTD
jgi:phage protein D